MNRYRKPVYCSGSIYFGRYSVYNLLKTCLQKADFFADSQGIAVALASKYEDRIDAAHTKALFGLTK